MYRCLKLFFACTIFNLNHKCFVTSTEITVQKVTEMTALLADKSIQISFVLISNLGKGSLDLLVLGEMRIPYAIIDVQSIQRVNRGDAKNSTHIKHGKLFMHVNPPMSMKEIAFPGISLTPIASSWIKSCMEFLGLHCNRDSILAKDIFLYTNDVITSTSPVDCQTKKTTVGVPGLNNLVTEMKSSSEQYLRSEKLDKSNTNQSTIKSSEIVRDSRTSVCFLKTSSDPRPQCELMTDNRDNLLWMISTLARLITHQPSVHIFIQNLSHSTANRSRELLPLTYKQNGNSLTFVSNGLVLNSLVFISRKLPPSDGMSETLGPMSLASWIGLVLAYALTAIVFGVVKALTINNLDESLYEYFLQYMLRAMSEDYKSSNNKVHRNKSRLSVGNISTKVDELGDFDEPEWTRVKRNPRVSVCYSESGNKDLSEGSQGQISKAILHVTIRIVSFVLIASYEGKLYTSITFPQPQLISTFDELVASDQYSIKVTKEAVQGGQFRVPSVKLPKDEMIQSNESLSIKAQFSGFKELQNNSRVTGSVTIEDCINWVESNSDSNNACIGYEFELRNLHKTHRFDKLVAKSNKKLYKNGLQPRRHRGRSSRLFPGAFQISKWIMESGLMQLWNLAETSFTDSIGDATHANQSKTFTIKDYMGLFTVYFVLLFLSCVLFASEFGVWWTKCKYGTNYTRNIYSCSMNAMTSVKQFVENIVQKSKFACRKVRNRAKARKIYIAEIL